MAYIVMVYIVMAYIGMVYIVMASAEGFPNGATAPRPMDACARVHALL